MALLRRGPFIHDKCPTSRGKEARRHREEVGKKDSGAGIIDLAAGAIIGLPLFEETQCTQPWVQGGIAVIFIGEAAEPDQLHKAGPAAIDASARDQVLIKPLTHSIIAGPRHP